MTLIYMKLNPKLIALVSYMEGKFSQASVMWVFSGKYMCPTSILCMDASIFFAPILLHAIAVPQTCFKTG